MSLVVTLHSHSSTGYNSPPTTLYRNRDLSFPPQRKDPTTVTVSLNTLCSADISPKHTEINALFSLFFLDSTLRCCGFEWWWTPDQYGFICWTWGCAYSGFATLLGIVAPILGRLAWEGVAFIDKMMSGVLQRVRWMNV